MFTNEIFRKSAEAYAKHISIDTFTYDGRSGFMGLIDFLADNEEFELEMALAYVDREIYHMENPMPYPTLPINIGA